MRAKITAFVTNTTKMGNTGTCPHGPSEIHSQCQLNNRKMCSAGRSINTVRPLTKPTKPRDSDSHRVEILLETGEDLADGLWWAEVGHGVGDGVVILQAQERGQLGLVQFLDTDGDVV